jgi:hypothetical protein
MIIPGQPANHLGCSYARDVISMFVLHAGKYHKTVLAIARLHLQEVKPYVARKR